MITLALSKGRIFDETLPLLAAAGIAVDASIGASRKLILPTGDPDLRLIIVRASDVPTYVQYGAADLGVAGKDVLLEHSGEGLYQPVDLGIARCRMSVAAPAGFRYAEAVRPGARLRIATKYLQVAREHFAATGRQVEVVKVNGSVELAPLVGLAHGIVDLVATGRTLRENGLVEREQIFDSSARLIANRASLSLRADEIGPLVERMARAVDR